MASRQTSRALLTGLRSCNTDANPQIKQKVTSCLSCNGIRCLSVAATIRQHFKLKESYLPEIPLRSIGMYKDRHSLEVLGRKFPLSNLHEGAVQEAEIQSTGARMRIPSINGHESRYPLELLLSREWSPRAKSLRRSAHAFRRYPWGSDHQLKEFDYESMKKDDRILLNWLLTIETKGSAMIKNVPKKDAARSEMIEHIAFVKQSHYGSHSLTNRKASTSNVDLTNIQSGMHEDPLKHKNTPGITCIHCVQQHGDTHCESFIADGLFAAELLRKEHPEAFGILSYTDPYFWQKGHVYHGWGMEEYYKTARLPKITDNNNAVSKASRDSCIDIQDEKATPFYSAMKLFSEILYDNSVAVEMDPGDMVTLDNGRCHFDCEEYEDASKRHFEFSYLEWDDNRSCQQIQKILDPLVIK